MSKRSLILLLSLLCLGLSAFAEEWTKSYQVGNNPTLRVDTNDASIEISRGVSNTINARVVTEGQTIGNSGVRITERQDGEKVDLQVHVPNEWGFHFNMHRGVRVEVQVPPQVTLDLHSGDGHIAVAGVSGQAQIDTGDGHISVQSFNGALKGHTGDGHMSIDGMFTNLDLRSGDGHIDLTVRPGSKVASGWLIHTSDGRVEARLPEDLAAELYAHTGDGRIQLDMPVTVSGSIERSRIRGKLNGGGPLLEITTGDGSIRISKF
ncbi:MAG TPA: DUF4097 family beta strand repeat-containing protein [Terriglobales bacterium]|nr:DUF4097 family beta strand repeat-containing protein [Terriglobales bacterium]